MFEVRIGLNDKVRIRVRDGVAAIMKSSSS